MYVSRWGDSAWWSEVRRSRRSRSTIHLPQWKLHGSSNVTSQCMVTDTHYFNAWLKMFDVIWFMDMYVTICTCTSVVCLTYYETLYMYVFQRSLTLSYEDYRCRFFAPLVTYSTVHDHHKSVSMHWMHVVTASRLLCPARLRVRVA